MFNSVCDWPLLEPECAAEDSFWATVSESVREAASAAATEYLWNWTGQKFGLCNVTLNPCRSDCRGNTYDGSLGGTVGPVWQPALVAGQWLNLTCGSCGTGACACSGVRSLELPGPVEAVTSLIIDGVPVLAEDGTVPVRVFNRSMVTRTDGESFPTCNDLSAAPGSVGTWSISYTRGNPVPIGGQIAAFVLAEEFAKALCSDRTCRLPNNTISATRQGVSIEMQFDASLVELGHTGLWEVDSWVQSVTLPKRRLTGTSPRKFAAKRNARPTR